MAISAAVLWSAAAASSALACSIGADGGPSLEEAIADGAQIFRGTATSRTPARFSSTGTVMADWVEFEVADTTTSEMPTTVAVLDLADGFIDSCGPQAYDTGQSYFVVGYPIEPDGADLKLVGVPAFRGDRVASYSDSEVQRVGLSWNDPTPRAAPAIGSPDWLIAGALLVLLAAVVVRKLGARRARHA